MNRGLKADKGFLDKYLTVDDIQASNPRILKGQLLEEATREALMSLNIPFKDTSKVYNGLVGFVPYGRTVGDGKVPDFILPLHIIECKNWACQRYYIDMKKAKEEIDARASNFCYKDKILIIARPRFLSKAHDFLERRGWRVIKLGFTVTKHNFRVAVAKIRYWLNKLLRAYLRPHSSSNDKRICHLLCKCVSSNRLKVCLSSDKCLFSRGPQIATGPLTGQPWPDGRVSYNSQVNQATLGLLANTNCKGVKRVSEKNTDDEALEWLTRIVSKALVEHPLPLTHRADFIYSGAEFKKKLRAVLMPRYNNLETIKQLYNLLSSFLNIETPSVKWDYRKRGNYRGLYKRSNKTIYLRKPAYHHTVLHEFYHYLNDYNQAIEIVMWLALVGLFSIPDELIEADTLKETLKDTLPLVRATLKEARHKLLARELEANMEIFVSKYPIINNKQ